MFLFWYGLIVGAVWLVRAIFRRAQKLSCNSIERKLRRQEIFDQRYDSGEITRKQHEVITQGLD